MKAWIAVVAAGLALVLVGSAAPAGTATKQDVTIRMDDGVSIAATLFEPSAAPPAGGWPAVVLMHGLGGDRSSMNLLATASGLAGDQYVVLTFDARGHGASGGLIGFDGPREIKDVGEIFHWLASRPEIAGAKIGVFGISYGAGAALNSLAAGVPWAAVVAALTWTDLYSALAPDGLPKSGILSGIFFGVPASKLDPSVLTLREAVASRNPAAMRSWAATRSSLRHLRGKRTPVFFMQGRRDFTFGMDQAIRGYRVLTGPRRLWIGNLGHPPSSFSAPDTPQMLHEGKQWYDRFLLGVQNGIDRSKPVTIAAEGSARVERFASLPRTVVWSHTAPGRTTIGQQGKVVRALGRTRVPLEVFGSPTVRVTSTTALGGWSRLVAVLSAQTPAGQQIVVADGGTGTRAGTRTYTIGLQSTATLVPKGSRLTLTLASASTAQSPSNLVYLDLPMPSGAKLRVGAATIKVPTLSVRVSR